MDSLKTPTVAAAPVRHRRRVLPPTLFAGFLAGTVVVSLALPRAGLDRGLSVIAGAALVVAGAGLDLWSDRQLKRAATTVKPEETPTALVSSGAFRLTRNPMYVGMTVILAGVALTLGSALGLACAALFALLADRLYIVREEAALSAAFGPAYAEYRRAVRRWI